MRAGAAGSCSHEHNEEVARRDRIARGALAFAAGAAGEHSVLELVSTGPAGGNDAGRGERRHPRWAVLDAAASSPRV